MSDYALTVSDVEVRRYRAMAERARESESAFWTMAGIIEAATVADIGCGPAATSVVMAEVVGPSGRVIGVERDESALAAARVVLEQSGAGNVELRQAAADATGLDPGSCDVVVMRHVLAHNGQTEQAIVDHIATLVRPGGCVYLVDADLTGSRTLGLDPELGDLFTRYVDFQRARGNDLQAGIRLGRLLAAAGLEVVLHRGDYNVVTAAVGMRPAAWAARNAMLADGLVTADEVGRWDAALQWMDTHAERPTLFLPQFTAIGRRPSL